MIKLENKLEYLADSLVPENIKNESPQFYGLVKAFLVNLEDVQNSINNNLLDNIDFDKIKNDDIKRIYIKTFLGHLEFKNEDNIESLGNAILTSKDLTVKKGTILIHRLLMNLLFYILPGTGGIYKELLLELEDPNTTQQRKEDIQYILDTFKLNSLNAGLIEVNEEKYTNGEIIPFKYEVVSDISKTTYEKYLKPMTHPAGWEVTFIQVIFKFAFERIKNLETITMFDSFEYPYIDADGDHDGQNTNLEYPNNYYPDPIMGIESEYNSLVNKVLDPSKLYIDSGNVYYQWDNLNNPANVLSLYGLDKWSIIETPTIEGIWPTGGSYASTEHIAYADGVIAGDMLNLSYEIKFKQIND